MGRPKSKDRVALYTGDSQLPTISVGGESPSKASEKAIKKDTSEKIAERKRSNPDKPKSSIKDICTPLDIKTEINSLDNEYIELAKRYLGINPDLTPDLVTVSKAVIKVMEQKNEIIDYLRKRLGQMENRPLMSCESCGQWN